MWTLEQKAVAYLEGIESMAAVLRLEIAREERKVNALLAERVTELNRKVDILVSNKTYGE